MKVIIFYGTECTENTAWIPWLKEKLNKANINCIIPNLPTPENQDYKTWSNIVKDIDIDSDDIVIGWSTGAIFAVRFLLENNKNVKKLILISGFNNYIGNVPFVDNINKDFFLPDLSQANNISQNIICIKSDNDPFITQEALNAFAKELNAEVINIENGGRFNASAGFDKFDELFALIIK